MSLTSLKPGTSRPKLSPVGQTAERSELLHTLMGGWAGVAVALVRSTPAGLPRPAGQRLLCMLKACCVGGLFRGVGHGGAAGMLPRPQ